jgi:hypothetical protein
MILCGRRTAAHLLRPPGSIFLGRWTPESVGDYASGTNHVLPTYGYARMYGGVSLDSFQKFMTVQVGSSSKVMSVRLCRFVWSGGQVATLAELNAVRAAGAVGGGPEAAWPRGGPHGRGGGPRRAQAGGHAAPRHGRLAASSRLCCVPMTCSALRQRSQPS